MSLMTRSSWATSLGTLGDLASMMNNRDSVSDDNPHDMFDDEEGYSPLSDLSDQTMVSSSL
jgi:hypothetical protein